jgi:hypothetical protein
MSDNQTREQTRILSQGLQFLQDDLRMELPKLRHRNDNMEDMQRQLNAWLAMRFRNHMVTLGRIAWGMNVRFTMAGGGIIMEAREDSEIGTVVKNNAVLIDRNMRELYVLATGPLPHA